MRSHPRIFISATSKDLKTCRDLMSGALITLRCMPIVQDHLPTSAGAVREMLRKEIAACDAVIHLAGECYGTEPRERDPAAPRRSYTQLEYDIARELGKEVYALVCVEGFPYDAHAPEPEELRELQRRHRAALMARDDVYYSVENHQELGERVRELRVLIEQLVQELHETRAWLGRGVAVAAVASLLISGLLWGLNHRTADILHQTDPVAPFEDDLRRLGVDWKKIKKEDFRIEFDGNLGISSPGIQIVTHPKIKEALHYAILSYAIGDGPFQTAWAGADHISSNSGGNIRPMQGVFDGAKLWRDQKITIKYELDFRSTHRLGVIGPFTYEIDPRKESFAAMKRQMLARDVWVSWQQGKAWDASLRLRTPSERGAWHLEKGLNDGLLGVREVWAGENADRLILSHTFPEPPLNNQPAMSKASLDLENLCRSEPLRGGAKGADLCVKLKFFDGTESEVRKFTRDLAEAPAASAAAGMTDPMATVLRAFAGNVEDRDWAKTDPRTGELSFFDLYQAVDTVRRIYLGTAADHLTRVIDVLGREEEPDRIDPNYLRDIRPSNLRGVPVPVGATEIFAQIEFKTGKRGEVRRVEFSVPDNPGMELPALPPPTGASVSGNGAEPVKPAWLPATLPPPAEASAPPAIYAVYQRANEDVALLIMAPNRTERILCALNDGTYQALSGCRPQWSEFRQRAKKGEPITALKVLFQKLDGTEEGPFSYSLAGIPALLQQAWKPQLRKRLREVIRARRVSFALGAGEEADAKARRALKDADLEFLEQIPAVICTATGSESALWVAAKEVFCGETREQMSRRTAVGVDAYHLLEAPQKPFTPDWRIVMPAQVRALQAQVEFFDGTKSEIIEVPIEEVPLDP